MNIDSVLKMIEQEFSDIPDFLLVKNRVPLTSEQQAKLAALKVEHPSTEDKWARNRRLYDQEGDRLKALTAEKARPAKLAFYAKMKAEADEIKAVKQAAKAAHIGIGNHNQRTKK